MLDVMNNPAITDLSVAVIFGCRFSVQGTKRTFALKKTTGTLNH